MGFHRQAKSTVVQVVQLGDQGESIPPSFERKASTLRVALQEDHDHSAHPDPLCTLKPEALSVEVCNDCVHHPRAQFLRLSKRSLAISKPKECVLTWAPAEAKKQIKKQNC